MARLQHRGPDGLSKWSDDFITLGHTRLAIVDLSDAGTQPMLSQDGTLSSVVNGEIYNYPELRRELEAQGHVFQSDCDSEIVLPLYQRYGADAFAKLNGMFALAIWDSAKSRLILARDRMGIKPLYYHQTKEGGHLFASEIKALFGALDVRSWPIDPNGLSQYLTYQNQFGATTLFRYIKLVEPGCYLEIAGGQERNVRYWEAQIADQSEINFPQAVAAFQDCLAQSVRRHLMSDVGVACYLSAGFDSSAVASAAAAALSRPPQTFTGRFTEGGWYDEMSGAALVARNIEAPHRGVEITADRAMAEMDNLAVALDAPQMGMGALPQYLVAQAASEHCKVILTGHGGDELFSGYPVFKLASVLSAFRHGLGSFWTALRRLRASELPYIAYFTLMRLRSGEGRYLLPVLFSRKHQARALHATVWEAVAQHDPARPLQDIQAQSDTLYAQILNTYLKVYLPGLLVVEDKISMAHALEARTPMLDNAMVALSLSLSPEVKLNGGVLKAVIKEGTRDLLPPELYSLPKRGFPTPLRSWLRGPMKDWATARLTAPDSPLRRLFRPEYLTRTARAYQTSFKRTLRPLDEIPSHRMWMLLSLEAWLRQVEQTWHVRLELEQTAGSARYTAHPGRTKEAKANAGCKNCR